MTRTPSVSNRQRGAGLVETLVGVLIGMLVILVIYSMVSAAEGYRRATTGASDAQITGLLSQFIMGRDLANGGNGTMLSSPDLINCTKNEAGAASTFNKPVAVMITTAATAEASDTFVSMNSSASRVLWPVDFTANAAAGANFEVQTPNGFTTPAPSAADPYWVIVAANDGSGRCQQYQIQAATAADAQGRVQLTPVVASTIAYAAGARLINLGPTSLASRVQYESWNTALGEPCGTTVSDAKRQCQLTSRDVINPDPATWPARNPIAANVVLVKVQYGVDMTAPNSDGLIDCWTPAVDKGASPCNGLSGLFVSGFTPAGIQAASLDEINRIMAVRIAVVVRSDEIDLKDDTLVAANGKRPAVTLFDCPLNPGCVGSVPASVPIPLSAGSGAQIIQDNYRYRVYETIVPLRNSIFVNTM